MSSKDERIVQMTFDNAQFEKGVAQTRRSLKELDQSLDFKNATEGFSKITSAASGVDLSAIAAGVESLQNRFSLFGIMGMKVMEELAGAAINIGKKLWSVTFGQIKSGGINRAMNVENAHFMLQGLLKDEAKVQEIMDWAMDSVDGTAYAFDSAAKAASQFAASGVTAEEDMTKALKAITGVAAMTNSEYDDISRIFTTVAGNGRLMGDQLLQLSGRGMNAASTIMEFFNGVNDGSKTASEGVTQYVKSLTHGMQVGESEIREFVSKGKINFDVFSEAMNEAFGEHAKKANETLTGVLSNVKAALSKIGADFVSPLIVQNGPLVEFFNALRESINRVRKEMGPFQKEFVNTVTKMAAKGTAFFKYIKIEYIFQALAKSLDLVKQLIKPIGEAFNYVFGEKTIFQMNVSLNKFKEFIMNLQVSERVVNNIKGIFGGFFAALNIGKQVLSALLKLFSPLLEKLFGFSGNVMDASASVGELIMQFDKWLQSSGYLNEKVEQIQETVGKFVEKIKKILNSKFVQDKIELFKGIVKDVVDFLKEKFGSFDSISSKVQAFFRSIKNSIESFLRSDIFQSIKTIISGIWERVTGFALAVWKSGKSIISILKEVFDNIDTSSIKTTAIDMITGALHLLGEAIEWLGGVAVDFSGSIGTLFDGIGSIAGGILEGLIDIIKNLTGLLAEDGTFSLDNLLDAVAIGGIIAIINQLSDAISKFTNGVSSDTLKQTAEAIGILTLALTGLSNIEKDKLQDAIGVISLLFGELVGSYQIMRKTSGSINGKKIGSALKEFLGAFTGKGSFQNALDSLAAIAAGMKFKNLIDIAKAILILAGAVTLLSLIPKEKLNDAIGAVSILALELTLMFRALSKIDTTKAIKTGTILISSALAILILTGALKSVASLDMEAIERGVIGLAYIMTELAILTKSVSKSGNWFGSGVGFILLATSLIVFGKALRNISDLSYEQLSGGLVALGGGLLAMATGVAIIGRATGGKGVLRIATALTIISAAMVILAEAIGKIAVFDINQVGTAMAGLAGGILTMILALVTLNMLPGEKKMISVGIALNIIAASFVIFAEAISKIAGYDLNQIGGAMAGLAGSMLLVIAALAAINMLPNEKQLIRTGIALNLIGASMIIFAEAISKVAKLDLKDVGTALAGLAGAMLLSISALAAVDMLPNERQLIKTGLAINIIAASMIIFAEAINRVGGLSLEQVGSAMAGIAGSMLLAIAALASVDMLPGERELLKTGAALVVIGLAMNVFAEAISRLAKYDINQVGSAMAGIAGSMLLAIAALAALNMLPGETELFKIGAALGIMGAAMIIFGDAIKNVAGVKLNDIGNALAGLAGTMALAIAALAALSMLPNESGLLKTGAALIVIGGAMNVFGYAIKALSDVPLDTIGNSLAGLAGAMLLAVAAFVTLSKINSAKLLKTSAAMVVMGAAIGIFAHAIALLDGMSVDNMLYAVLTIGILLGTVAGIAAMLSPLATNIKALGLAFLSFGAGVGVAGIGIAAAAAAIAALIVAVIKLADIGGKGAAAVADTLRSMIIGISDGLGEAFAKLIDYFDNNTESIIAGLIGILETIGAAIVGVIPGLLVGAIEGIVQAFKDLADSDAVLNATDSLSRILTQAAEGLAQNVDPLVTALVDLFVNIFKTLGDNAYKIVDSVLTLLEKLINALAQGIVDHSDPLLDAIKNIFAGIAYFIVTLLQDILSQIPGLGEEVANNLEEVKNSIKDSMSPESAAKFAADYEKILEQKFNEANEKVFEAADLPDIVKEDWLNAQARSMAMFGTDSMTAYLYAMDQALPHVRAKAEEILSSPISLADKQKQLYELLGGDMIDYYSKGMNAKQEALDQATKEMWEAQQELNYYYAAENRELAKATGEEVEKTIRDIPQNMRDELYKQWMQTPIDMRETVAQGYRDDGQYHLAAYFEALSDPAKMEELERAARTTAEIGAEAMKDASPKYGQSASSNIDVYTDTIKTEGTSKAKEATKGLGDTVVDGLGEYVQPLKDKGKEAIGTLTDNVSLEIPDYTSEMDNLMNGGLTTIEGYDGLYEDATKENVNSMTRGATSAGDNYIKVMSGIGSKGPLELVRQKNEFKGAGQANIGEYTSALSSNQVVAALTNAIEKAIMAVVNKIADMNKRFLSGGEQNASQYASGINAKKGAVENAGEGLAKSGSEGAASKSGSFKQAGINSGSNFASGIENRKSLVKGSAAVIAQGGVEGAGSRHDQFIGKGHDAGQGFANGIQEKNSAVYNKAWALAGQALAGLRNRLRSASPSKETKKIGGYAGDGFAIGIESYSTRVKQVSEELAEESLDALQNGIAKISKIADSNMDYAPTITPVLDLTNVTSGIASMNTMFDDSHAVAAQASFDMYQNYSNPDYISQFAKMSSDNEAKMAKIIDKQTDVLLDIRTRLAHQQIVLDSGELVGATINKIDEALGERMIRAGRGN